MKNNWKKVKLETIVNFEKKSKRKVSDSSNTGVYPFYSSSQSQVKYIGEYDYNGPAIIFGTGGSANVHFESDKFSTSADCYVVKNNGSEDVLMRYIFLFLKSNLNILEEGFRGAGLKHVSKKYLEDIQIPLPPLHIQKKIADALDKADEIRRKRQEAIDKLDELMQSVFLDMFGDPVKNEKGWETAPTIKFSESIVPGRDKPKSFTGNIPWVTTNDLNHLGYTYKSSNGTGLTESEIKQVKAKIIPRDSVIITCVGDLGIASVNKEAMVVNQQLHAFQCGESFVPEFLMLNLSHQKEYMFKMASTTTVPYMNKTVANNIPTIVPPKELQEKFRDLFVIINNQKKLVGKSTLKDTDLFNSLLQKAFRGSWNLINLEL